MLLATMWNSIKNIFSPIYCKTCKSKHYTAIGLMWHLWKKHGIKITIYSLTTRLIIGILCAVFFVPLLILKFILLPLYYLYEIL